jgi:hypothetical protein
LGYVISQIPSSGGFCAEDLRLFGFYKKVILLTGFSFASSVLFSGGFWVLEHIPQ